MTKLVALLQARDHSTRLPHKATTDVNGKVLIHHVYDRLMSVAGLDGVVVSTSENSPEVIGWCNVNEVPYYAGPEEDLIFRHLNAAIIFKADEVLRVTADCLFHDPYMLDMMIQTWNTRKKSAEGRRCVWASNWIGRRDQSEGLDAEIYETSLLSTLYEDRDCPRENFPQWLTANWRKYPPWCQSGPCRGEDIHLSIDTSGDLERARRMLEILGNDEWRYSETLRAWEETR